MSIIYEIDFKYMIWFFKNKKESLKYIVDRMIQNNTHEKQNHHHHDWIIKKIEDRIAKLMTGDIEPSIPLPPKKALEFSHIVSPPEKTRKILEKSRIIAKVKCECRKLSSKPCEAPLDVCLIIDSQIANEAIKNGIGEKIFTSKAMKILDETAEIGLVHMLLHLKDSKYHAICSCCSCCCHDLVALLKYKHNDLVKKSEYVVNRDKEICIDCKNCINYCNFKAFSIDNKKILLKKEKCYGCGICVIHCPSNALRLEKRSVSI